MGLFNFGKNNKKSEYSAPKKDVYIEYKGSSPFVKIGKDDITKPYIYNNVSDEMYIRFGYDNLFPQLIDQLYYTSPLHSSTVKFQILSATRNGFEFESNKKGGIFEVDKNSFIYKTKLPKLISSIALDIKLHQRVHFLCKRKNGKIIDMIRVVPSKVRYNKTKTKYWVSDDWTTNRYIKEYRDIDCKDLESDETVIYSYTNLELSPGQDVYPLPSELGSFNWIFLDGESSSLQKQNIQRTIFGNLVIKVPKKFEGIEEYNKFKNQFINKEGEISPVLILNGNGKDNIPEVEAFPVGENDKLFDKLYERIDDKICQAHTISPILMGVTTTGKLGNASELEMLYPIWVNTVLKPFQNNLEEIVNNMTYLMNYDIGRFKLNELDYSFVNKEDKKEEDKK